MIKASAGGGGKGMRIAWNDKEVRYQKEVKWGKVKCGIWVFLKIISLFTKKTHQSIKYIINRLSS